MDSWIATLGWNAAIAAVLAIVVASLGLLPFLARRPALRHGLWLLVLVKLVTPPVIPVPVWSGPSATNDGLPPSPPMVLDARADVVEPTVPIIWADPVVVQNFEPVSESPPTAAQPIAAPENATLEATSILPGLAIACWAVVAMSILVCATVRTIRIRRTILRAMEADPRLVRITNDAARRIGVRSASARLVDGTIPPMVWVTWSQPIILYPRTLVAGMSDDQILGLACHELAHVHRGDQWINAFAAVVTALFWWHPVSWIAWREMRRAQEVCCDEMAVLRSGVPRSTYLETLLRAIDSLGTARVPAPASGFSEGRAVQSRFRQVARGTALPTNSGTCRTALLVVLAATLCVPVSQSSADDASNDSAMTNDPTADEPAVPSTTGPTTAAGPRPVVDEPKPLYLHWYLPQNDGPMHIVTTAVVPSEPFGCVVGHPKDVTIKLEGQIELNGGRYTGRVDSHFQDFQRFTGEFVLEQPVSPSLQSVVSRVLPGKRVVLSHERDFEKFIERPADDGPSGD